MNALSDPDRAAARHAFDAMMGMRKIEVAAIESARRDCSGEPAMAQIREYRKTKSHQQQGAINH